MKTKDLFVILRSLGVPRDEAISRILATIDEETPAEFDTLGNLSTTSGNAHQGHDTLISATTRSERILEALGIYFADYANKNDRGYDNLYTIDSAPAFFDTLIQSPSLDPLTEIGSFMFSVKPGSFSRSLAKLSRDHKTSGAIYYSGNEESSPRPYFYRINIANLVEITGHEIPDNSPRVFGRTKTKDISIPPASRTDPFGQSNPLKQD